MNKTLNNRKRIYNLDLLRILVSFMVVVIHVSSYRWASVASNTLDFYVYNVYDSLARSAVPLFIMISGVFFLDPTKQKGFKNIFKKYIIKLTLIYIIWGLIYYFYNIAFSSNIFDWKDMIHAVVDGPYHFWYIPTIIGLYIVSPILSCITKNANKKTFYYLFILFLIGCFLKTIINCSFLPHIQIIKDILNKFPIGIVCQYYSYFLLGYFLYYYDISLKHRKYIYILGVLSFLCCMFLTLLISQYTGVNTEIFYNYFSVFTFFEACALFLSFKHGTFKSEKEYGFFFTTISNCTLGIYVVHVLVMNFLFDFGLIHITNFNPFLSIPIVAILVFIISFFLSYIIRKVRFKGDKSIF